jgi:hypothetical protein
VLSSIVTPITPEPLIAKRHFHLPKVRGVESESNDACTLAEQGSQQARHDARNEAYVAVVELMQQTQKAGVLGEDFVPVDLVALLMANAGVVAAAGKAAPRAARRLIGYFL